MIETSGGRANGQLLPESLGREVGLDRRQARAAAAQVDPAGQQVAPGELLDHQLDAGRPDRDVVADDPLDLGLAVDLQAPGEVDLERLGPGKRQVEPVGQRLRERAAAEGEHPGAFDAALADEGDVGRATADVDEDRAGLLDLLRAQDAGHGVRLGDDLEQLQVELRGDRSGGPPGGPAARTR